MSYGAGHGVSHTVSYGLAGAYCEEMPLTYVEVLRDKRQTVVAEIERLRAEAAAIANRIATKESQLHNLEDLLALEGDSGAPPPSRLEGSSASARSQRFIDAAYETLKSEGKPLHYRELAQRLADAGVYVPGKDPAANLIAHMSRDPRFGRSTNRGVYGIVEWPAIRNAAQGRRPRAAHPASARRQGTAQRG